MHVYCITNLANGKIYIGQTIKDSVQRYLLEDIWHANSDSNGKPLLYRAYRKYKKENFSITSLIRPVDKQQMDELEKFFIRILDTRNRSIGYNISAGGEGSSHPCLPKTRAKISASNVGKVYSLETRERMSKAHAGKKRKPLSEVHKENIRQAKKGIPPSPATIAAMRQATLGTKRGPRDLSVKQRISEKNRKKLTPKQLSLAKYFREQGRSYYWIAKNHIPISSTTLKRILTNDYISEKELKTHA